MSAKAILISFFSLLITTSTPAFGQQSPYEHQKYWDGVKSPKLKWSDGCTLDPAVFARDNPAYTSPPLMALGDSLYNGVQSLRINWWLSEWSVPSLIAIRLGLIEEFGADRTGRRQFYGPQYPSHGGLPDEVLHYGFNLETPGLKNGLARIGNLLSVPAGQRKNLGELLTHRPPNGRAMVDNLAFSGANSRDLIDWTPEDYRAQAIMGLERMRDWRIDRAFGALGDTFTYANAAFVLNPMQDDCLEKLTPLEQVELRRPKRLLINIGSNNGLYKVAFQGVDIDDMKSCGGAERLVGVRSKPICVQPIKRFLQTQFIEDMKTLTARLSRIDGLEYVYVNNLALPSQTANVIFSASSKEQGIFKLDISNSRVKREVIDRGDRSVNDVNEHLQEILREYNTLGGPHFVYVDQSEALRVKDYKKCVYLGEGACAEERRLKVPKSMSGTRRDVYFDNRPMKVRGGSGYITGDAFASKIAQGGLFSFDNMHLSSLGYELMALAVRVAMKREKDPALIVLPRGKNDRCPGAGQTREHLKIGDCIGQLTQAGWSVADYTRRDFVFQRLGGDREMRNREFISAVLAFMN